MTFSEELRNYRDAVRSDGTVDEERFAQFCDAIERSVAGGLRTVVLQRGGAAAGGSGSSGGGSGGGGGGGGTPAPSADRTLFVVPNTIGALAGALVNYKDELLRFADARVDPPVFATHVVVEQRAGLAYLAEARSGVRVLMRSGRGTEGPDLWLWSGGTATDRRSDIVNGSTGALQAGVFGDQLIGARSGAESTGGFVQGWFFPREGDATVPVGTSEAEPLVSDVDLDLTSATAQALFTAAGDGAVVTGVLIRAAAVASAGAAATVQIRQQGGDVLAEATLHGLDVVDEGFLLPMQGVVPVLDDGDVMECNVQVAATAGTLDCKVDVFGYYASVETPAATDLDLTSATAQTVFTATENRTDLVGVLLRVTEATAVSAPVAKVVFQKSGGAALTGGLTLFGLNAVGEAWCLLFEGVVPRFDSGDALEVDVETASGASALGCSVTVVQNTPPKVVSSNNSLDLVAGGTQTVFTSGTDDLVITHIVLRVEGATSVTDAGKVQFQRQGGSVLTEPVPLFGLTATGKARVLPMQGVVPVFDSGDVLECVVTAATASALTVRVDVLGISTGASA